MVVFPQARTENMSEKRPGVIVDGPFVVFFADDTGVHAAAWFDRDSFRLAA